MWCSIANCGRSFHASAANGCIPIRKEVVAASGGDRVAQTDMDAVLKTFVCAAHHCHAGLACIATVSPASTAPLATCTRCSRAFHAASCMPRDVQPLDDAHYYCMSHVADGVGAGLNSIAPLEASLAPDDVAPRSPGRATGGASTLAASAGSSMLRASSPTARTAAVDVHIAISSKKRPATELALPPAKASKGPNSGNTNSGVRLFDPADATQEPRTALNKGISGKSSQAPAAGALQRSTLTAAAQSLLASHTTSASRAPRGKRGRGGAARMSRVANEAPGKRHRGATTDDDDNGDDEFCDTDDEIVDGGATASQLDQQLHEQEQERHQPQQKRQDQRAPRHPAVAPRATGTSLSSLLASIKAAADKQAAIHDGVTSQPAHAMSKDQVLRGEGLTVPVSIHPSLPWQQQQQQYNISPALSHMQSMQQPLPAMPFPLAIEQQQLMVQLLAAQQAAAASAPLVMIDPWGAPMRTDTFGRPATVDPAGNVLVFDAEGNPHVVDVRDPTGAALLPCYYNADGELAVGTLPLQVDGDRGTSVPRSEPSDHAPSDADGDTTAAAKQASDTIDKSGTQIYEGASASGLLSVSLELLSAAALHTPAAELNAVVLLLYARYRCRVCGERYSDATTLARHVDGHRSAAEAAGLNRNDVEGMRNLCWSRATRSFGVASADGPPVQRRGWYNRA